MMSQQVIRWPFALNFGSQWSKEQIFGHGMFRLIKGQTPLHTHELGVRGSLTISLLKFPTLICIFYIKF